MYICSCGAAYVHVLIYRCTNLVSPKLRLTHVYTRTHVTLFIDADRTLAKVIGVAEALHTKVDELKADIVTKDEYAEFLVNGVCSVDSRLDSLKKQMTASGTRISAGDLKGQISELEAQLVEKDQFAHDFVEGVRKERERLAGLQAQVKQLEHTVQQKDEFAAELVQVARRSHSVSLNSAEVRRTLSVSLAGRPKSQLEAQ
jgi:BMFP domain-containing protein YqiC